jgi:hypothetical protein
MLSLSSFGREFQEMVAAMANWALGGGEKEQLECFEWEGESDEEPGKSLVL